MSDNDNLPQKKNSKNTNVSDDEILKQFGWSPDILSQFKVDLVARYQTFEWETNDDGAVNLRVTANKVMLDELIDNAIVDWSERFGTTHGLSTEQLRYLIYQALRARKNHLESQQKKKAKGRKRKAEGATSDRQAKKQQSAATGASDGGSAPKNGPGASNNETQDTDPRNGPSDNATGHRENQQEFLREIREVVQAGLANQSQGTPMNGGTTLDPSMVETLAEKLLTCALHKADEPDWTTNQLTERLKKIIEATVEKAVAAKMANALQNWHLQDHPQIRSLIDMAERVLAQESLTRKVPVRTLRIQLDHSNNNSQIVFLGAICALSTVDVVRARELSVSNLGGQVAVHPHTAQLAKLKEEARLYRDEDVFLGNLTYVDPVTEQPVDIDDDDSLRVAICLFHQSNKRTLPIKVVDKPEAMRS